MATPINASVLKALDILDLFGPDRAVLSAEDVAAGLGMAPATAHRFLVTLEAAGIITAVRRGAYGPGPRLVRLGQMAEALAPLPPQLVPTLTRLCQESGESVMACRYSPAGPVCVAVAASDQPISVSIRVGTTLPMLRTAQGKLWLSGMSEAERRAWARRQGPEAEAALAALGPELAHIRTAGFARNQGANEPDIAALSVPVQQGGHMALTLSVFGMLSRFDEPLFTRAEQLLTQAAQTLST